MKTAIIIFAILYSPFSATFGSQYAINKQMLDTKDIYHYLEDTIKSDKIAFILKVGINMSNMNFNKGYHLHSGYISPSWKDGYFAGAAIQIKLPRKFFLTQDYILTRRKGMYSPSETLYTLDYLSLPLLLGFTINNRFSFITGPQFELLIAGKENSTGQTNIVTKTIEERSVGWVLGLQYVINTQFFLETRFMQGLNNIGINQRQNRTEFRYELFQISVNYLFK